jgi:hypothetical protein
MADVNFNRTTEYEVFVLLSIICKSIWNIFKHNQLHNSAIITHSVMKNNFSSAFLQILHINHAKSEYTWHPQSQLH